MTSPSSSNSNGLEPQLPPLLPPLRSTQHILQPLSVFPGAYKFLSLFFPLFIFGYEKIIH